MPLTLSEFNQFKKLMALTTSTNDAEALAALRKANEIIVRQKVTWFQILDRVVKVEVPIENIHDDENIEALFEEAMSKSRGDFLEMLESIYEQWEERRTLTPRQREVVVNAARGL